MVFRSENEFVYTALAWVGLCPRDGATSREMLELTCTNFRSEFMSVVLQNKACHEIR